MADNDPQQRPDETQAIRDETAYLSTETHDDGSTSAVPTDDSEDFGPAWPTIAFGAVCLTVAIVVGWLEISGTAVDWRIGAPVALVTLGGLVTLIGAAGLVRRPGRR